MKIILFIDLQFGIVATSDYNKIASEIQTIEASTLFSLSLASFEERRGIRAG